jgi:hypothetical protein
VLYLTTFSGLLFLRFAKAWNLYTVVLFALFLFAAFRFEVGCDWSGYYNQYQLQLGVGWEGAWNKREPLWWLTVELTQRVGLPYPWLNVFSSAIFFAGVHVFARRQPDPLGFLILLFPVLIVNMPMSGIRQGAAIGLICIALAAFVDRRLIRFVVFVFLAAGFHSSAVVFLLLAPLVWGEFTKRRIALAAVLAVPGVVLLAVGGDAELAFSRYVETGTDAFGAAYRTGVLFLSGLFFVLFLRRPWFVTFPKDYKLASLGALMMLCVFPLVALSTVIADRLGYYFIPLQAMIFARTPFLRGGSTGRLLTAAPYVGLALVFIVWTSTSRHFQLCYVPYKTWIFGFPEGRYFF